MILTKTLTMILPVIPTTVCQYAIRDDAAERCSGQWIKPCTWCGQRVQGQWCRVSGAWSAVQQLSAVVCSRVVSCIAMAVMLVMPDFYTIVTMLLDNFEISWIAIHEIKASNVPFLQSWPTEEFVVFMIMAGVRWMKFSVFCFIDIDGAVWSQCC